MNRRILYALLALALAAGARSARAEVTLTRDAAADTWTMANGLLRITVNSAGRVPSLVKMTGAGAGANQAVPSYAAFLERVNEKTPTGQAIAADADGDDSAAKRSLKVTETIDTGAGAVFNVTKTYRLRDGDKALEAELSFQNTSGVDWLPPDPHKGAESLVYAAPGGSAPAGDAVQVDAGDGLDIAAPAGTTWWGGGAAPRRALEGGWLAAVDGANGVINAVTWDLDAQKQDSADSVPSTSVYRGSNRFQLETWRTRLPAGQTVSWKQYLIVDEGIPFVSFAAYGSFVGGVETDAPAYAWGQDATATLRLNSTRLTNAAYDLRAIRLLDAKGGSAVDLPDIPAVSVAAGARAAVPVTFAIPDGTAEGAYTLRADVYEYGAKLGSLASPPVLVTAPAGLDKGDADGDGAVSAADAAMALQMAGGFAAADARTLARCDLDGDGAVSLNDAFRIAGRAAAPEATQQVLTILHTNDMHGHVLSNNNLDASGPGGLARLNTLARPIRADMPNVLFLDAGDNVQATPTEFYSGGFTMFAALNAAGYDAGTLGNHEFDWGQDQTAKLIREARFPMLAANVRDTRTGQVYGGAREYVIFQRGAVKIAVFGLTTVDTVPIEWPPTLSHVRFEDPTVTAQRLVPLLRSKADIVIALTHLGVAVDKALAAAVPGIDVIVGGHSHTTLSQHVWVGSTLIAQTGSYANNLGRIDLLLAKTDGRWTIVSVNGKNGQWWADQPSPPLGKAYPRAVLLPVTQDIAYDPAIQGPYQGPFNQVANLLNTPVANVPSTIQGSGSSTTPRPLTSTMAELLRKQAGADVGMMPALGANLPAGTATIRAVYTLYGGYTRQNVLTVRATGADIRAAVVLAYAAKGQYPVYFGGL
jgi:2',3'-cyclic-nucleotide 2'-phosphodiesterase (5'-nucleotidase family)